MHHAWMGGLLEHILSLMGVCELAAQHYPNIDRDLLLTGVVLHDIGKLRELSWGTSFDYTLEGQLLGHITIGIGMIEQKIAAIPNFPAAKRLLVEHLVLSHHGEYEFGSPKLPMTPEAILLHYLDNLDAKMQTVRSELAKAEASGRTGAEMTEWVRPLERQLLNTQGYPQERGVARGRGKGEKPAAQEQAGPGRKTGIARNARRKETMPYLLKTEPGTYSVDDLEREGETVWDGVSNPVAVRNLAGMQRGEMLVIYHTGDEKRTVGLAKVVAVDASDAKNPQVRIKFVKKTKTPRTLAEIKAQGIFADSPLVRQGRLSVVPLNEKQYGWLAE